MKHVLAVDWDLHEARYVLASISGKKVKVRAASSVHLVDVTEGAAEPRYSFGSSLSDALAKHKARRAKLLVSVPRSSIELLHFTLPPAKDNELPELVANVAMREAPTISEQWILDFVRTDSDDDQHRVTTAALSPEELNRVQQQCATAGLKPQRLLLRPLAAASVFSKATEDKDEVSLLVNRIGCEVDLNVMAAGDVVFSRTARLPEGSDEQATTARLLSEITRTLAAVPRDQIGDDDIESIYIFGGPDDYEDLVTRITDELSKTARVLDPFAALGRTQCELPEDRGRFAALLGMLLDEATGSHAVDFLHPRRPPPPVSRLRVGLLGAAAVAMFVFVIGFYARSDLPEINKKNKALSQELAKLKEATPKAAKRAEVINAIGSWTQRDLNWLDELRDLSIRCPGPRDAVVLRMSMRPSQSGGGMVSIDGLVRDPKVVIKMQQQIRDQYRRVRSPTIRERRLERDYTWYFDASIAVARRSKDAYVSHLPAGPAPPADIEATVAASDSVTEEETP